MIGADAILEGLRDQGVKHIFGYPGGAVLPLYDRLPYHNVSHILVRHEQGAGFAAAGYARVTGNVGVCLATSGPGATNLVTALADAKLDSIPMVAITGNVFRHLIGSDAFQEVDTVGIVEPIVKHAFFVDNADDIGATVREAFRLAKSGRPGPVLIDITKNAQADTVSGEKELNSRIRKPSSTNDASVYQRASELISLAKRPVVIYGHGVALSGAEKALEEFLEKSQIPAVWTLMGIGGTDETGPRRYGMLGMHGTIAANHAVHTSDCIIGIGTRFDDRIYGKLSEFQRDKCIIHFDIDPSEFGKNVSNTLSIPGDLSETLRKCREYIDAHRAESRDWQTWRADLDTIAEQNPLEKNDTDRFTQISVIDLLYEIKKDCDIVTVDVGQHEMWAAQRFRSRYPRTFHASGGLGTMGFSLPTAIGGYYGMMDISSSLSDTPTLWSISGDGGFQMNIQELGTIMAEKLPIKIIILNNSFLGMVRQWQELFYKHNYVDTPMQNPDFATIAQAYGITGLTATNHEEARQALEYMKQHDGPILCNFLVENETNVYPMVPAGKSLGETMTGKES